MKYIIREWVMDTSSEHSFDLREQFQGINPYIDSYSKKRIYNNLEKRALKLRTNVNGNSKDSTFLFDLGRVISRIRIPPFSVKIKLVNIETTKDHLGGLKEILKTWVYLNWKLQVTHIEHRIEEGEDFFLVLIPYIGMERLYVYPNSSNFNLNWEEMPGRTVLTGKYDLIGRFFLDRRQYIAENENPFEFAISDLPNMSQLLDDIDERQELILCPDTPEYHYLGRILKEKEEGMRSEGFFALPVRDRSKVRLYKEICKMWNVDFINECEVDESYFILKYMIFKSNFDFGISPATWMKRTLRYLPNRLPQVSIYLDELDLHRYTYWERIYLFLKAYSRLFVKNPILAFYWDQIRLRGKNVVAHFCSYKEVIFVKETLKDIISETAVLAKLDLHFGSTIEDILVRKYHVNKLWGTPLLSIPISKDKVIMISEIPNESELLSKRPKLMRELEENREEALEFIRNKNLLKLLDRRTIEFDRVQPSQLLRNANKEKLSAMTIFRGIKEEQNSQESNLRLAGILPLGDLPGFIDNVSWTYRPSASEIPSRIDAYTNNNKDYIFTVTLPRTISLCNDNYEETIVLFEGKIDKERVIRVKSVIKMLWDNFWFLTDWGISVRHYTGKFSQLSVDPRNLIRIEN